MLIATWLSIVVILFGFAVAGLYHEEFAGYIAASIFPAATLLTISILISYNVKKENSLIISKVAWVILSIAVLLFVLIAGDLHHPNATEEAGMVVGYSMGILSFPACFLAAYLYAGCSYLLDYFRLSDALHIGTTNLYINIFTFWLGFFVAGYLQWFSLFPWLIVKWQLKRKGTG